MRPTVLPQAACRRPLASITVALVAAVTSTACPGRSGVVPSGETGAVDAGIVVVVDAGEDAGGEDAGAASVHLGFVFDGPRDAGAADFGTNRTLLPATATTGAATTIGAACTAGDDCAALGAGAACFVGADGAGFCTVTCPTEAPDPCPHHEACVWTLADVGLCIPACDDNTPCTTATLSTCAGPLPTFQPQFPFGARVCLPPCANDADCNSATSAMICNPSTSTCASPSFFVGAACSADSDCRNLGPGGACMKNPRAPSSPGLCTTACDPSVQIGGCRRGVAVDGSGHDVPVTMKSCGSDAPCKAAGNSICQTFPAPDLGGFCSLPCASDDDCAVGSCDTASGDCRLDAAFAPGCASSSSCPDGLCVLDFHAATLTNCSRICDADVDCAPGDVCVKTPTAHATDDSQSPLTDPDTGTPAHGFCAPRCTVGEPCADETATCLEPTATPEIDFSGQGSASSPFCWR